MAGLEIGRSTVDLSYKWILESKKEGRALSFFPFGPDPAAVTVDDPVYRCQADTETFDLIIALKALKGSKKLVRILLIEARSIVAHKIDQIVVLVNRAELDPGIVFIGGV